MNRFVFAALFVAAPAVAWSQDAPADPAPAAAVEAAPEAAPPAKTPVPTKEVTPAVKKAIEASLTTKTPVKLVPPALEVPTPRPANMEPKAVPAAAPDGDADPAVKVSGYLRARYGAVLDGDGNPDFVGLNDGFSLDNARLTFDADRGRAAIRVSIDGAVDRRAASNTAQGQVDVGLKDAHLTYGLTPDVDLVIGQFKPPFDAEERQATLEMTFIDRAVESRGVHGTEGYNINGLSLDRQAGVMLQGTYGIGGAVHLAWAAAATNGSGANRPTNDNDRLAYTGRVELGLGESLQLGGAVNFNEFTNGAPPDLLVDEMLSVTGDLAVHAQMAGMEIDLRAQYIQRETTSKDVPQEPSTVARGFHAAIGLGLPMVSIGYRFATLDPTATFDTADPVTQGTLDADAVTYHTIGVNWTPADAPCGLKLNYTVTGEQAPRELSNDRLDVLVQAAF